MYPPKFTIKTKNVENVSANIARNINNFKDNFELEYVLIPDILFFFEIYIF